MKKLLLLFSIVTCMSLISSCKKSDDKLLIGTWELKTASDYYFTDGVSIGGGTTPFEPGEVILEFRKDNTWTLKQVDEPDQNGSYSLAGDQLTMEDEAGRMEISKTTLALYFTNEEVISGHTQRQESEMHLEKQ